MPASTSKRRTGRRYAIRRGSITEIRDQSPAYPGRSVSVESRSASQPPFLRSMHHLIELEVAVGELGDRGVALATDQNPEPG